MLLFVCLGQMPRFCIVSSASAEETVINLLVHALDSRNKLRDIIREILSNSA